ncbi:MAG: flagellar filament capping protein FliD [Vulcanimicrobiota bacterium]
MAVTSTSNSGFQVSGIISGLDTDGIIQSLVGIEKAPLTNLDEREAEYNNELTAWRSLNTRLLAMDTTASRLTSDTLYEARKASLSDSAAATVIASPGKDLGTFSFSVESLATRHQQISQGFAETTSSVGSGTITIKIGSAQFNPITIDSQNSTLAGVRDAINQANVGVTASIVDSGEAAGSDRYHLILNSKNTGTKGAMDISFNLAGGTAPALSDLQTAADATIKFGKGANAITITSSSNTISDVLPGVTLDLKQAKPGESIDLTISSDRTAARTAVTNFLSQFNAMSDFFKEQFEYDAATGATGTLFGDAGLLSLQDQLSSTVTSTRYVKGDYYSLAQIGITLDQGGHLSISDEAAFSKALENPESLKALFNDSSHGVITKTRKLIDQTKTVSTGLVDIQEKSINTELEAIHDKRLDILRRADATELLLRKQFAAMETALAALRSQSSQLASQISSATVSTSGT